ncbi:hypothetical protein [Desulfurella sp.]|uniref:hypothetical protein n=1 Tax=Desulfurella sp. TaxID=1962857 RepID=UPI0025BF4825|nr:hypothetical protein [Desulfurella sp.]
MESVQSGTTWTSDLDIAVKLLYEKCYELKSRYKIFVEFAGIIAVYYQVIDNKVKIVKKQLAKDMTEEIEYCFNFDGGR